jgi:alkylation response protein AidB-like acyl-CoA dehydrogenase
MTIDELRQRIAEFLAAHDPATTERVEFLRARYNAGLAWLHFPERHGGLGLPQEWQVEVDHLFDDAGAPDNNPQANAVGLGMAGPMILAFGTEEQKRDFLRPLWTGEDIWCQLFSEPGAGSDLAAVSTRAVRDAWPGSPSWLPAPIRTCRNIGV